MPLRARWLLAATAAGLATVSSATTPAVEASDFPAGWSAGRAVGERIDWRSCGPQLQCAKVRVPLDWDRPAGRKLRLAVIRRRASRPDRRIGSLFLNPGGPGMSGVDLVRGSGAEADALGRGRFDVVSWDIRGSGRSAAVSCFPNTRSRTRFWANSPVPTTRAEKRRYLAKTERFARRCGDRAGDDLLAHITTADTARDLDHLRRLVGDRRLSFYAVSAGTMIGQTYANMYPRRIRAMALDAVVDPVAYSTGTAAWLKSSIGSDDRLFAAFLSLCQSAGPSRCALAGDVSAADRARQLIEGLRRSPLPAPAATPPGMLTSGELLTVLRFTYLPSPSIWPQLAANLKAAADGDGSLLEMAARATTTEPARQALEPTQAIICADSPAKQHARQWPRTVDRLTQISFIGGPALGWLIGAPCTSWPVRADRYMGPWTARTPNPILLVGTRLDPNTPLAGAQHAARLLGNAVLVTHDGYGHVSTSDPSACVDQAVTRYLVSVVTPPRGTICRADRQPFDPDFGKPLP